MSSTSQAGIQSQGETLSSFAVQTLDKFLTDSITTSLITQNAGNGSAVVVSSGSKGDINIAITPPDVASQGSLSEGTGKTLEFQLPANTGLVSKNVDLSTSGNAAKDYVTGVVEKYLPTNITDPALIAQKNTIIAALTKALELIKPDANTNITVSIRNIDFYHSTSSGSSSLLDSAHQSFSFLDSDGSYQGLDSLVGSNDILLDAGTSTGSQLFVINLGSISGRTLVLQNVEGAVLAGPGTVRVEGSTPIRITTDLQAQNVTGGAGNDTLVGTGNDTLTGGSGSDIFGFSGAGKYTVTDFNKAADSFAFNLPGVTNLDQLKAQLTSITKVGNATTYNLGADTSITLVGVSATDLTASMFKFTV